jgi:hypothetical protein
MLAVNWMPINVCYYCAMFWEWDFSRYLCLIFGVHAYVYGSGKRCVLVDPFVCVQVVAFIKNIFEKNLLLSVFVCAHVFWISCSHGCGLSILRLMRGFVTRFFFPHKYGTKFISPSQSLFDSVMCKWGMKAKSWSIPPSLHIKCLCES